MRSRERLIDVLETVNGRVVGRAVNLAFAHAALSLRRGLAFSPMLDGKLSSIADWNDSPHLRSLAAEALFYQHRAP